ncbi:hypothetical protein SY83_10995 [Paenibacillus swuensis]|uniref:Translational regulator CsrA n=1 Tax=Paenibacillus swuensis TaxID=1178515 RepID=A0A172TI45_9BACL|nr:carbon storage regulator CsrA [Paenibacillus swuensis]ANE46711.1 hypothetical protein SY83_10995 [Paenibacillus swuensis]
MLVLSRKKGESIIIGDQIEVTILSVEGDAIKLGINAPKHIEIFRKELYDAILTENKEAIGNTLDVEILQQILSVEKERETQG